jgi:hypothetical protein
MAKHAISSELYDQLTEKLDEAMDERDDVAEKKGRVTRARGGELKVLDNQVKRLRRQRKGLESLQEEIPGTEAGERRIDPAVTLLLRAADGLPARPPQAPKKKGAGDAKARAAPAPLHFLTEKPGVDLASVEGGIYSVRSSAQGYSAIWDPDAGRMKTLVAKVAPEVAYEACDRHNVERQADLLLKGAGAGELTKADTKGDAVAWKVSRRG